MVLTASIINHNSVEAILKCLESINNNLEGLEAEVFVVDNLCENKAGSLVSASFPFIQIIENDVQMGFGANHNQVIRIARGKYILVINPDVVLPKDALNTMAKFMDENPNVAVCGPGLVDVDGTPQKLVLNLVKPLKEAILLVCYISNIKPERFTNLFKSRMQHPNKTEGVASNNSKMAAPSPTSPLRVPWISGACMFFRRSALEEIGGFDERFFLYFEETDWCLRALNRGKDIYHLPEITATHIGGTSTRPHYHRYLITYLKSAIDFYEKHKGKWVSNLMAGAVRCVAVINWIRWSLAIRFLSGTNQGLRSWVNFSRVVAFGNWSKYLNE